jgi:orotate phosphoribosyltransferase
MRGTRAPGDAWQDVVTGLLVEQCRGTEETPLVTDRKKDVLDIVREGGLTRLPEPVQLASGEWSRDFVDAKQALARGRDLEVACRAMIDVAAHMNITFDAVGGLTLGADAFAHGVALLSGSRWFVVRKKEKGRGTNRLIEGAALGPEAAVLLVDDVVTTGGSMLSAHDTVRAAGARVVGAVTLVDRGEAAGALFGERGVPYRAVLTYTDLGIEPVGSGRVHA